MSNAISMLTQNMTHSLACCGLDPDWTKMPVELTQGKFTRELAIWHFMTGVVDASAEHVCAYKAQKAFFDILPGGHELLKELIKYVHTQYPHLPVILDCKIGDIDNTMQVYIENIFEKLAADGVVINPYMGSSVVEPFFDYPDKAIVVLVKTSNLDGALIQDLRLESGHTLWEKILDFTVNDWNSAGNMVPVISSTAALDLNSIRERIPDEMPILFAGVGSQGGSAGALSDLLNKDRSGVFVNSSRGLLYPDRKSDESWQSAVQRAVIAFKDSLERERLSDG